jgi:hypothetical protein
VDCPAEGEATKKGVALATKATPHVVRPRSRLPRFGPVGAARPRQCPAVVRAELSLEALCHGEITHKHNASVKTKTAKNFLNDDAT